MSTMAELERRIESLEKRVAQMEAAEMVRRRGAEPSWGLGETTCFDPASPMNAKH